MIKAIETRYKGYRFRSRLEARWAVFFDALEMTWEYEPEGFHTSSGPYLPDFRVMTPQGNPIWYEVKPDGVETDRKLEAFKCDLSKSLFDHNAHELAVVTRVSLLSGDPVTMLGKSGVTLCPRCGLIDRHAYGVDYYINEHSGLGTMYETYIGCWPCDMETPSGGEQDWENGVLGQGVTPHKGWIRTFDLKAPMPWLTSAAKKSRSARFEHGETQ